MKILRWHSPLHTFLADPNLVIMHDPTCPGAPLRWFLYGTDDGYPNWGSDHFSVYVSDDLIHWNNGGRILNRQSIPWRKGISGCWAPTILFHHSLYYLYFVCDGQIGVARSTSPYGPFVSSEVPLVHKGQFGGYPIDPSILRIDASFSTSLEPGIDDNRDKSVTDWLVWGNTIAYLCPLSQDRMQLQESKSDQNITKTSIPISWSIPSFREALWIFKRKNLYYASWSENDARDPNYRIRYATAISLHGPWKVQGILVQANQQVGIVGTGHHSIVNIPGTDDWVIAYHCFDAKTGDGIHRQVLFARLQFQSNGLLNPVVPSDTPLRQTISVPAVTC